MILSYYYVDLALFECYGRQMDVKTTLCAYWVRFQRFTFFSVYLDQIIARKTVQISNCLSPWKEGETLQDKHQHGKSFTFIIIIMLIIIMC